MASKTLKMTKDKETKGAVRYTDGDKHSIYFRKGELAGNPEKITVTVKGS